MTPPLEYDAHDPIRDELLKAHTIARECAFFQCPNSDLRCSQEMMRMRCELPPKPTQRATSMGNRSTDTEATT